MLRVIRQASGARWLVSRVGAALAVPTLLLACSSSSGGNGPDSGLFGPSDTGSSADSGTKRDGVAQTSSDCAALKACCASSTFPASGRASCNAVVTGNVDSMCVSNLAAYTQEGACAVDGGGGGPPADSPCGTLYGPTWCAANATGTNGVLCDDFDSDALSSYVNYVGVFRTANFVNTHWVSEFCSLHTYIPGADAGEGNLSSSYTEHPYDGAPSRGAGSVAFDLFVPGSATCNDTVITRVLASAEGSETDSIFVYVTLSGLVSSGTTAKSYTLGLSAAVGVGGPQTAPQTLTVTPRSQDGGWARVMVNVTGYAIANPATVDATMAWYYEKDKTAQATTPQVSTTGQLMAVAATTGEVAFDVGLIAMPGSDGGVTPIPAGCDLFLDNIVSSLPQ
jgi:hypothetical protein